MDVSGDRIVAGILGLVFVAEVVAAWGYPTDARLFPTLVGGAGAALALGFVVLVASRGDARAAKSRPPRVRVALALLAPPLYGGGLWLLGFWLSTLIALPALAVALGCRNLRALVLTTAVTAISIGLLFPLVGVRLPAGRLAALWS